MKRSKDGSVHVTDEVLNTAFHSAAAFFSLAGGALLVAKSAVAGDPWKIAAFSVYAFTLVLLYTASAMHHGLDCGPDADRLLRSLDYSAIFLLIAGTVTPLCLVLLRDTVTGWVVFGVCWLAAAAGFAVRITIPALPGWFTTTLFISMGWSSLILVFPLYREAGLFALVLLGAGGLLYTAGSVVFTVEKPNPVPGKFGFHEIWHLAVIAGSLFHYLLMYLVVLPF